MRVLALDTTTPAGSAALVDGDIIRIERASGARPPAERLPADLMQLLADAGASLAEVDAFAVATGPGSFTGLRIGIATMQALAFAGGKPLVGLSALAALARLGASQAPAARVATWVDAWRGEVYAALYEGDREVEPPVVARPDAVLGALARRPTLFIGDGAHAFAALIGQHAGPWTLAADLTPPLAGTIGQMAAEELAAGARPRPHAIRPLYVRRTDAELSRDARVAG